MPIYEYRCHVCGHECERLQKISDAPLTQCPACGADALQKLISAAGFRLKGQGWYETDFKQKNQRNLVNNQSENSQPAEKKTTETADKTTASGKTSTENSSKASSSESN